MKYFFRAIVADMYKLIHTKIWLVHILTPLAGLILVGGYILQSSWTEMEKIIAYMQVVAIVFPVMIAIVVAMLFEADLKAGRFQNLLFVPCPKVLTHFANLLPLLLLGMVASVLATAGFGVVLRGTGFQLIPIGVYGMVGVYLFGTNIAVYLLQYMICFSWGKSIAMGVGITGTVLSALLMPGVGDTIWKCCPYSYGIRCISYFMYRILKPREYMAMIEENRAGICTVAVVTAGLTGMFLIWSFCWQGTREKEE